MFPYPLSDQAVALCKMYFDGDNSSRGNVKPNLVDYGPVVLTKLIDYLIEYIHRGIDSGSISNRNLVVDKIKAIADVVVGLTKLAYVTDEQFFGHMALHRIISDEFRGGPKRYWPMALILYEAAGALGAEDTISHMSAGHFLAGTSGARNAEQLDFVMLYNCITAKSGDAEAQRNFSAIARDAGTNVQGFEDMIVLKAYANMITYL